MGENRKTQSGCGPMGCATVVVVALVLVLVLYVLSIGPTHDLVWRGHMSVSARDTIYAPILWICDTDTVAGDYLSRYMNWWIETGERSGCNQIIPEVE